MWCALFATSIAVQAEAQTFPAFSGFVVDSADVLSADQEAVLTRRLDDLQRRTGHQLVVATVPDLQGYTIEDYGYRLLRSWGVGLKAANNGAILLVAPNNKKVRIEVGYGLEPWLTDAFSSVVINRTVLPKFRAGDIPGGIVSGANAVADQLALPEVDARGKVAAAVEEYDRTHSQSGGGGGIPIAAILLFVVFAFVILPMLTRRGHRAAPWGRRYENEDATLPVVLWSVANGLGSSGRARGGDWGSGLGGSGGGWMGGGFTSGGGGSGGGGGASGSW